MNRATWFDRLHYAFDNTLSKGPAALIGWLGLASGGLIVTISAVVCVGRFAPGMDFVDVMWMSLLRTLDGGTMGADRGTWPFLVSMLAVTFGGIFVVSTLIGVMTSSLENLLDDLRKGRSKIVETGHTVVLGWSEQIFSILSELVQANANQPRSCIVVLGDKDKVEMEDAIRDRVGQTGRTRIVCRRGKPMEPVDLEIVSLRTAKSIIVLSPDVDTPDAEVIKTLLAIVNGPARRPEPYHIVAEIRDARNMDVAHLVGRQEVELVLMRDLIARTIAQTCRQSGLSVIHSELMDFAGDEIYFQAEPALAGKTFAEALMAYEDSAVIGICPLGGTPVLKPRMDTRLRDGDQIIAISEDDDTVRLSGRIDVPVKRSAIRDRPPVDRAPERTMMLGWNARAPWVIRELDNYVMPGSTVHIVADDAEVEAEIAVCCPDLRNEAISFRRADTTDRAVLEELPLGAVDHVIVLSCCDRLDPQQADARTLVTLLHLRDIADRAGFHFSIVSEMLDSRNRDLAEVTRADDFIVSPRLASLMLAQVSENKALNAVFEDIFNAEGAEIYLKPAEDYVAPGETLDFYTVVAAARERDEVAIGYRITGPTGNGDHANGVVVNPEKSTPITFGPGDRVIVLAEN